MMNDAPDSRLETHSQEGRPPYFMKLINIHEIEVYISACVSHVMPLKNRISGDQPKNEHVSCLFSCPQVITLSN